jgi:hypothetical protein
MCNYDSENRCWRKEFDEANQLMDINCGNGGIGYVTVNAYKKAYGRDNVGADICWTGFVPH